MAAKVKPIDFAIKEQLKMDFVLDRKIPYVGTFYGSDTNVYANISAPFGATFENVVRKNKIGYCLLGPQNENVLYWGDCETWKEVYEPVKESDSISPVNSENKYMKEFIISGRIKKLDNNNKNEFINQIKKDLGIDI